MCFQQQNKMKLLLIVVGALLCGGVNSKRYDNYQVFQVTPQTQEQFKCLHQLIMYDFWQYASGVGHPALIMVKPEQAQEFQAFIQNYELDIQLHIEDVQKHLEETNQLRAEGQPKAEMEWTNYHPLDEIHSWLDQLIEDNDNIEGVVAGETYEGREIRGIRIRNGANLPGVIIEAGIHAREWVTPAATSWIINEIINSANGSLWKQFNYLYVPNLNPDGYVYTFTDERLWRKTRKPYGNGCYGADPNRNFDNHWLEAGASTNPCSETFGGSEAFSEIETRSYSEYLSSVAEEFDLYIAFHSAAQLLIFPWGWTSQPAPLSDLWQRIGDKTAEDIAAVNGTVFTVGNIYDTIYPASATSMDWYYAEFNSTISYTFEMRSGYGFELPPQFIIPSAKEHLAGLQTIFEEYQKL